MPCSSSRSRGALLARSHVCWLASPGIRDAAVPFAPPEREGLGTEARLPWQVREARGGRVLAVEAWSAAVGRLSATGQPTSSVTALRDTCPRRLWPAPLRERWVRGG